MKIINADGSIPEMCGNGIRCLVKYISDYRDNNSRSSYIIETLAGNIEASVNTNGNIKVNMGTPIFDTKLIPTLLQTNEMDIPEGQVNLGNKKINIYAASMGNPHMILFVDSLSDIHLEEWGASLENDYRFPNKTNVHFVNIIDSKLLDVRVWDRGAGATLACGTGACATLAVSSKLKLCGEDVIVKLPGGSLNINWPNKTGNIYMTGEAQFVFTGSVNLNKNK